MKWPLDMNDFFVLICAHAAKIVFLMTIKGNLKAKAPVMAFKFV